MKTLKTGGETLKGSCDNFETKLSISCISITCTPENTYNQTCSDLGGAWQKDVCGDKSVITPLEKSDMPSDKTNCCK